MEAGIAAASAPTDQVEERRLTTWRGMDYAIEYRGTEQALVARGLIAEIHVPGRPGVNKYMVTIGRGHDRITVRRLSKSRLLVTRFHAPRPSERPTPRREAPARSVRPILLLVRSDSLKPAAPSAPRPAMPSLRLVSGRGGS